MPSNLVPLTLAIQSFCLDLILQRLMADSVREQDVGASFIAVKFISEWRMRTVSTTCFFLIYFKTARCVQMQCHSSKIGGERGETKRVLGRQQADQTAKRIHGSVMLLHAVAGIVLPM